MLSPAYLQHLDNVPLFQYTKVHRESIVFLPYLQGPEVTFQKNNDSDTSCGFQRAGGCVGPCQLNISRLDINRSHFPTANTTRTSGLFLRTPFRIGESSPSSEYLKAQSNTQT